MCPSGLALDSTFVASRCFCFLLVPLASLSPPSLLPSVASRYLPLLLPLSRSCRLAFGSTVVASHCLLLLLPPAGSCRLAFGSTAVASRCLPSAASLLPSFRLQCGCIPLPPVASCLWPPSSPAFGSTAVASRGFPSFILFNFPFNNRAPRGRSEARPPRRLPLSLSSFLFLFGGRCRYNFRWCSWGPGRSWGGLWRS